MMDKKRVLTSYRRIFANIESTKGTIEKDCASRPLGGKKGFKTIIKPGLKSQDHHAHRLKLEIRKMRGVSQIALISRLNPIIRGWCNYFSPLVSKMVFKRMNNQMFKRLWNWARRRHGNKSRFFVSFKYWRHEKGTWAFGVRDGPTLIKHTDIAIRRFVKVRGIKSPFDGDWFYWAKRMGRNPRLAKRVAQLLKKQKGKCTWCGQYFRQEDVIEKDHILAKVLGGKDEKSNYQLLHGHCHDSKTALDMKVWRSS